MAELLKETSNSADSKVPPSGGGGGSIIFTVTSDLTYDQRMIRICTSLANAGYNVTLVGRKMKASLPLSPQPFKQKRINCLFEKGKLFKYQEFGG